MSCSRRGDLVCGVCECDHGFFGESCQCNSTGVDNRGQVLKCPWVDETYMHYGSPCVYSGTSLIRTPWNEDTSLNCPKHPVCVYNNPGNQDTSLIKTLSSVQKLSRLEKFHCIKPVVYQTGIRIFYWWELTTVLLRDCWLVWPTITASLTIYTCHA